MKNIIILLLMVCLCFLAGCDEGELIEISDDNSKLVSLESSEDSTEPTIIDNGNNMSTKAGNLDSSRPFVVYICGEVRKPGVYELSEDSRVIDAIMEAGGYTNKACDTYLNLAAGISDAQMIYVPSIDEIKNTLESGSTESLVAGNMSIIGIAGGEGNMPGINNAGSNVVNINTASKEQLMTLPGIGESKADKIISFRESNGGFSSTEEIMQISGIKEGLYNKVKDKICVR